MSCIGEPRRPNTKTSPTAVGTTAKVLIYRQNSGETEKYSGEPTSMGLMIFGFLDENEESPEGLCNSSDNSFDCVNFIDNDDDDKDENCYDEEGNRNKAFWETQEQLLEATLRRTSSLESKIRHATKDAVRELSSEGMGCVCQRPVAADGCRNCIQREISNRLRSAGYNCTICKSKWRSSPDIPSGEHTYLEVMDNSSSQRGEKRVVIELNFQAEFEMARASEEYNRLIQQLPEVFVGKAERLRTLIKILCLAAKKCMEDKKMHMAPWRKHKYMQAKWFGKCEQIGGTLTPILSTTKHLDRLPKQRASMLTFDLLENLPSLHCSTAIRVV